jgi:HSP20 family molecular chaperone IbpA
MMSVPIYFNSLLRQQETQLTRSTPRYSISRAEDGTVELALEIPGVAAKDLSVDLENGNMLRIRGARKWKDEQGSEVETEFDRVFRLDDDIDVSRVKVALSSGILRVQAPQREKVIRSIPITAEDENIELEPRSTTQEVQNDVQAKITESEGLTITEEDVDSL